MCKTSSEFCPPRNRTDCMKLNRLYGKALADRCTSREFTRQQTRIGRPSHYVIHALIFPPTMRNPASAFACWQTLSCRSSHRITRPPIVPPTMRTPLARSARRQTRSGRQSHCIILAPIFSPAMRNHQASFARRAAARTTRSSTCCTAKHSPSAVHQASLPAGKLGAVGRAITSLARPFFRLPCASPLARSARRQILSCRQSHCIIHAPIIPPTM